eukprot:Selendium_serpulae@DN6381_c0_g1_i10.p1
MACNSPYADETSGGSCMRRENEIRLCTVVLSISNLFAYVANFALVWGFSYISPDTPTIKDVSDKFPTILTPPPYVFAIWGLIYLAELIFVIVQLAPTIFCTPYVQYGVSVWWISASIFQILWTFAWVYEVFWLSCILMFFLWCSLMFLNWGLYVVRWAIAPQKGFPWYIYWFVQVPFALHWGWITIAMILNFNVYVVAEFSTQLALHFTVVILSIAALAVWMFFSAAIIPGSGVWHGATVVWALAGILIELKEPKAHLTNSFPPFILHSVWLSLLVLA